MITKEDAQEQPRNRVAARGFSMVTTKPAKGNALDCPENTSSNKKPRVGVKTDIISFCDDDMTHVMTHHSNPLVISVLISDGPIRDRLVTFLRQNADVFTWTIADMPGISGGVMVHKFDINPGHKHVKQKRWNHSVEKLVSIR
ncbi:hypothetical protein Nepgr_007661 [Nepenthes gracilis]|uniref:Reverse transcriptase domain-containing protein n=1 Tax=Nepenthes gracilis TaxID=150966 RepID=A0AAD3XIQ6_NEPGR|nr:hypothetical protein Nepgr_007661 [Nepenthes gracilis]